MLAHAQIAFRRTHSIGELLYLMRENGCAAPPFDERLDRLDPYAVEARYGLMDLPTIDRERASRIVEAIVGWAELQLATSAEQRRTDE